MQNRRLSLKREVLQEISASDLGLVGGGAGTAPCVAETMYSCLMYISCAFLHTCYLPDTSLCIEN